jgi:hypothetical protein
MGLQPVGTSKKRALSSYPGRMGISGNSGEDKMIGIEIWYPACRGVDKESSDAANEEKVSEVG